MKSSLVTLAKKAVRTNDAYLALKIVRATDTDDIVRSIEDTLEIVDSKLDAAIDIEDKSQYKKVKSNLQEVRSKLIDAMKSAERVYKNL